METKENKIVEQCLELLKGLSHKEAEDIVWKIKEQLTLISFVS